MGSSEEQEKNAVCVCVMLCVHMGVIMRSTTCKDVSCGSCQERSDSRIKELNKAQQRALKACMLPSIDATGRAPSSV